MMTMSYLKRLKSFNHYDMQNQTNVASAVDAVFIFFWQMMISLLINQNGDFMSE